jgi:hypothetical protein
MTVLSGQDSQDRTVRTGLHGLGCQNRTARIRQPWQERTERIARKEQPELDRQNKTIRTELLGNDCQDRAAPIGLPGQDC